MELGDLMAEETPLPAACTETTSPGRTSARRTPSASRSWHQGEARVNASSGHGGRPRRGDDVARVPPGASEDVVVAQRLSSPARQDAHTPHETPGLTRTRSPTLQPRAPGPSCSISPAMSEPSRCGYSYFTFGSPRRAQRSRWFNATARTRTRTSRGPGSAISIDSRRRTSGPPCSRSTMPSVFMAASLEQTPVERATATARLDVPRRCGHGADRDVREERRERSAPSAGARRSRRLRRASRTFSGAALRAPSAGARRSRRPRRASRTCPWGA